MPARPEAELFAQVTPQARWSNGFVAANPATLGPGTLGPKDYRDYYALPSPLTLGLRLEQSGLSLNFLIDLRADFLSFITEPYYTNLPLLQNGMSPIGDANMPSVGFLEYRADGPLEASVGRRQLKWGPASYDMGISDSAPYFDHLWLNYRFGAGRGDWWFNYVLIGSDSAGTALAGSLNPKRKTLVAHRIGYEDEGLRIGLGEMSLIYGVVPDLADLAPLVSFHNLYGDGYSNAFMTATAEVLSGKWRGYGEFAMDDLVMPWEDPTFRTSSFGWIYGLEWRPIEAQPLAFARTDLGDYALREGSLRKAGGLRLLYEHYRTTVYMYNREDIAGKWVLPDHRLVSSASGYVDSDYAFFIGFPYGPDTSLDALTLAWEGRDMQASLALKYLRQGAYGIQSAYVLGSNTLDWYRLVEPVASTLLVELAGTWVPMRDLRLDGSVSLGFGEDFRASLSLGATYRMGAKRSAGTISMKRR